MNGVIQIKKQKGGDALDIYLEPDASTWYYFTYSRGTMLAVSSNAEFNKALEELKGKNKKMNVEKPRKGKIVLRPIQTDAKFIDNEGIMYEQKEFFTFKSRIRKTGGDTQRLHCRICPDGGIGYIHFQRIQE